MVEQTVRMLREPANEKGLDLRLTVAPRVPTYVRGDAVRWEQVLTNLGSNAVKFTDRGSVEVAVDLVERRPDGVLLEVQVRDTGVGHPAGRPAAALRRLHPGRPVDHASSRRHRTRTDHRPPAGRGAGGELGLHSEVGSGTTFRFTAAFGTATGDAREFQGAVPGSVPAPTVAHRVLVVEDNQVNQMVAVGLLESAGYATEVARGRRGGGQRTRG